MSGHSVAGLVEIAMTRRLQFSLRTLLVAVAVCALGFGAIRYKIDACRQAWREEQAARQAIRDACLISSRDRPLRAPFLRFFVPKEQEYIFDRVDGLMFPAEDVGGRRLAPISDLTKLRVLRLIGCRGTDEALEHIRSLRNIELLELDHSDLTDRGMEHVGSMTSITALRIGGTKVTDEGFTHIAKLTNLQYLEADYVDVSDAALQSLSSLKHLRDVRIGTPQDSKSP